MTDRERQWTALALALFFHFIFLRQDWKEGERHPHTMQALHIDMESLASARHGEQGGLALDAPQTSQAESTTADMQRKAFLQYLEAISQEVHSRRLENEKQDLIGVALFSLMVNARGGFTQIRLEESSGKSELDAAARRAIDRASGVIKRPSLLGAEDIPVMLQVKYQYGLR